ncbi:MAG: hypothetical protein ACI955_002750, partial [Zhongshania sp.]
RCTAQYCHRGCYAFLNKAVFILLPRLVLGFFTSEA